MHSQIIGQGQCNSEFENALFAYEFDVKEDCGLSVEPADVPYGENIIISLNYNSSATGKVNITLKGKKGNYTFQNIDLNATVLLDQTVESDKYNITVTYSGDDTFFNATAEGKLAVFPENTFSALNYLIRNNDEIILAGDYSFDSYWDSDFRDGILIDKPLSVIGNGHEIDAKGEARIFYVAAESINITDVTFRGGKADNGGAIYFRNDVRDSTINVSFIANEATWDGGANFFAGKVENVTITGNFADNTVDGDGGANYFWSTLENVTITGNFISNQAKGQYGDGGANYFREDLENVDITGNFTSNSALEGGANLFLGDIINVTLNGNFTNNTAFSTVQYNGGGANWFSSIINYLDIFSYFIQKINIYVF